MQEKKDELWEILPFINFILSLLIVMHHSFTININYDASSKDFAWAIQRYLYNISECAVPVFFFISAILFYRNYINTKDVYKNKVRSRMFSLLLPYVLFNFLGYIKYIIFNELEFSVKHLVWSICLSDTMPLWFLRELFFLVLLAPMISHIRKNNPVVILSSAIITILVVLGIVRYRCFIYWFPMYLTGSRCTIQILEKMKEIVKQKKAVGVIFAIYMVYAWFLPNTTIEMNYFGNFMFYFFRMASIGIWVLLIGYLMNIKVRSYPFMKYSFWVYCVHFPLISLTSIIFNKFIIYHTSTVELIKYFITIISVYFFSVVTAIVMKKFCPLIWKILNGGRK